MAKFVCKVHLQPGLGSGGGKVGGRTTNIFKGHGRLKIMMTFLVEEMVQEVVHVFLARDVGLHKYVYKQFYLASLKKIENLTCSGLRF